MKKSEIEKELDARQDRLRYAWKKGVICYAYDLIEELEDDEVPTEERLLNGAKDWEQYSYGGCSLIYDEDICKRLCSPSVIRRKKEGELPPNSRETWLDVQAQALRDAAQLVLKLAKK